MLPVKWMPPEAFLDGIFTAKVNGHFLMIQFPFGAFVICCWYNYHFLVE